MARRRAKAKPRRRTRYKSAFNLKNLIFTYAHLSLATGAFLRTTPLTFLLGGYVPGFSTSGKVIGIPGASSGASITLKEIIDGVQSNTGQAMPLAQVMDNTKANIFPYIIASAGLTITERVLTKLGVFRSANKSIRMVPGMGDIVKF